MTFLSPTSFSNTRIKCNHLFTWALVIFLVNHFVGKIYAYTSPVIKYLVTDLLATGVFPYMAWYAMFRLLHSSNNTRRASLPDILVVCTLNLLVFIPTNGSIWLAATGLAIYILVFERIDYQIRAVATILAGLCIQQFWSHVIFQIAGLPMLRAETALVGTALKLSWPVTEWHENVITMPDGHGILLYPYCSTFHNVTLGLLCWISIVRLSDVNWRRSDLISGSIVVFAMILLNTVRLYLMALSSASFTFWHDGAGSSVFVGVASLTVLVVSLYGTRAKVQDSANIL